MVKKFASILIAITLLIGVCGCMNQNDDIKYEYDYKSEMLSYVENKYSRDFSVTNFTEAKDETYTNILSLSDGEVVFNVYQQGDDEITDDYPQSVLNKKIEDVIKENSGLNYEIYVNGLFVHAPDMTLEYVRDNSLYDVINDYALLKIILIVNVDDISAHSDDLFNLYKTAINLEPKYIDFEVLQVDNVSSDLEEMLNNLPGYYDNSWDKYPEIEKHLSVTETNINSLEELMEGIE